MEALELVQIPGVGPKLAKQLATQLGIKSPSQLKEVLETEPQKLLQLERMGEGKLAQLKQGLKMYFASKERKLLGYVYPYAQQLRDKIASLPGVEAAAIAGSFRRMKETVGDIDILVVTSEPAEVIDQIAQFDEVAYVIAKGATKISIFVKKIELQVDVRVVQPQSWGAALQYFT